MKGGECTRARTWDPRLKRPLLCQLSYAPTEIWLAAQISDEANCAYNEPFIVKLDGPCDIEKLEKAIQIVVRRHEALHLCYDIILLLIML